MELGVRWDESKVGLPNVGTRFSQDCAFERQWCGLPHSGTAGFRRSEAQLLMDAHIDEENQQLAEVVYLHVNEQYERAMKNVHLAQGSTTGSAA